MVLELFPSLVAGVVGLPERLRIGHVNRDRHPESAERVPHRIEPRVVDLVELVVPVAKEESQPLELLEPAAPRRAPSSTWATAFAAKSGASQSV